MSSRYAFIGARFFGTEKRDAVDWIVLHSTESDATAEQLARFWSRSDSPHVSAHYVIDDVKIVQCVEETASAWAAGPHANRRGLHIEMRGHAASRRATWCERKELLALVAQVVAELGARWNVPLVFIDADALRRGERGVTTHAEISKAFAETTHWDPGPGFPLDEVLELAQLGADGGSA